MTRNPKGPELNKKVCHGGDLGETDKGLVENSVIYVRERELPATQLASKALEK